MYAMFSKNRSQSPWKTWKSQDWFMCCDIIDESNTGLCTVADLTGNGEMSKILISTCCRNTYISAELYNQLEHEPSQALPATTTADSAAYYLNDLTNAKSGVIKSLWLPGHTFSNVPVIVTPSFPAYSCDIVLGIPAISKRCMIDHEKGFVIISDE